MTSVNALTIFGAQHNGNKTHYVTVAQDNFTASVVKLPSYPCFTTIKDRSFPLQSWVRLANVL